MKILFMGASRLVGLLERFQIAAEKEDVHLELLSLEDDSPWHAISAANLCRIIPGPLFNSAEFAPFLFDLIQKEKIDIVVPNIDSATVYLAPLREKLFELGSRAIVSNPDLCIAMNDKVLAEKFFLEHGLSTPYGTSFPLIAKPRIGSASRGHFLFEDEDEFDFWLKRHNREKYLVQPFIRGTEYSIDAFVSEAGDVLGSVSRVRVVVSGGEVMVTRTEHNSQVENIVENFLKIPGWYGPITLQVVVSDDKAYLIECNPRFGSGVPCAIEAGLDIPRWLIRESLGRPIPNNKIEWQSGLCMTRSRKDYFVWLS
jgi:carbamoyl-phosphate synthase large subunit